MEKRILKSVRISEDVLNIIEAQPGENFTAKLEGMIRTCYLEMDKRQAALASIQKTIDMERSRLRQIRNKANEIEDAAYQLSASLQSWNRQATAAVEKLEAQAKGL